MPIVGVIIYHLTFSSFLDRSWFCDCLHNYVGIHVFEVVDIVRALDWCIDHITMAQHMYCIIFVFEENTIYPLTNVTISRRWAVKRWVDLPLPKVSSIIVTWNQQPITIDFHTIPDAVHIEDLKLPAFWTPVFTFVETMWIWYVDRLLLKCQIGVFIYMAAAHVVLCCTAAG